jgi:hypothetical protein
MRHDRFTLICTRNGLNEGDPCTTERHDFEHFGHALHNAQAYRAKHPKDGLAEIWFNEEHLLWAPNFHESFGAWAVWNGPAAPGVYEWDAEATGDRVYRLATSTSRAAA